MNAQYNVTIFEAELGRNEVKISGTPVSLWYIKFEDLVPEFLEQGLDRICTQSGGVMIETSQTHSSASSSYFVLDSIVQNFISVDERDRNGNVRLRTNIIQHSGGSINDSLFNAMHNYYGGFREWKVDIKQRYGKAHQFVKEQVPTA